MRFKDQEITFVFGSNLAGIHGKGAALFAKTYYGAKSGVGEGVTGRAYAIPTKKTPYETLNLEDVEQAVQRFIQYAQDRPQQKFLLTEIGCGLAGFTKEQIAPLFTGAPNNVILPGGFVPILTNEIRVAVVGSRSFNDATLMIRKLDHLLSNTSKQVTIISGGARGADTLAEDYADAKGIGKIIIEANWDKLNNAAGQMRNRTMASRSTHCVAFWDGVSPGTKGMIQACESDGVITRVIRV